MTPLILKRLLFLFPLVIVGLGGCKYKTYNFIPAEVPQGKPVSLEEHDILETHLQTVRVYNQFSTVAFFDALLLDGPMRTLHTDSFVRRTAKKREDVWKDQSSELDNFVSFYILSDVRSADHASLSDDLCPWSIQLANDRDEVLTPASVSERELTPEFTTFFGYRVTPHKTAYLVKFLAKNEQGDLFIKPGEGCTLFFCSVRAVAEIHWPKVGSVEKCDRPVVKTQANKALRYDPENRYWV